jgi:hypothetical protein
MRIQQHNNENPSILVDTECDGGDCLAGCDEAEQPDVALSDGTECDSENEI